MSFCVILAMRNYAPVICTSENDSGGIKLSTLSQILHLGTHLRYLCCFHIMLLHTATPLHFRGKYYIYNNFSGSFGYFADSYKTYDELNKSDALLQIRLPTLAI